MLAVLRSWQVPRTANVRNRPSQERRHTQVGGVDCLRRFLLEGGSPGNADWEGRKADSIGIGPVHLEWTIVDGGEKMRVPAKPRRLLRGDGTASMMEPPIFEESLSASPHSSFIQKENMLPDQ